jgi:hypothetical protein
MGVTILAIFAFIGGALTILGALALFGVGALFAAYEGAGGLAFIFGIVALVLGFLYLYLGYGFWTLKRAAWSLGLVVFGAGIVISLIEVALGYDDFTGLLFTVVINGVILYYLMTPAVKAAFGVTGDLQSAVMTGLPGVGGGAAAASSAPAAPPAAPAEPAASTWTPPPAAPSEPAPSAPAEPERTWSATTESSGETAAADEGAGGEGDSDDENA